MVRGKLNNYSLTFKNHRRFFYADIPLEFRGLPTIKTVTRYMQDTFSFHTNSPIELYIATLTHYPNPLPDYFEDMQQTMQVLQTRDISPTKVRLFI
jgi:hypothetical protein